MVMRGLSPWNGCAPTSKAVDPFTALDRVFNTLLHGLGGGLDLSPVASALTKGFHPTVDIEQAEDAFRVRVELPGLGREDIGLSVEDDVLTITGEKSREEREGEDNGPHYSERSYGRFTRHLRLPETVDQEAISAALENGVLTVTLPLLPEEEPAPNRVDIAID